MSKLPSLTEELAPVEQMAEIASEPQPVRKVHFSWCVAKNLRSFARHAAKQRMKGNRIMHTSTLIVLVVLGVLLFGGGGGYYWNRRR